MKTARDQGGWALMEVTVAMVLLGIVVVAICQAWLSLAARAVKTEDTIAQGAVAAAGTAGGESWSWGATVEDARWLEGPRLQVSLQAPLGIPDIRLGVWINGWLHGDFTAEEGLVAVGDPLLWQAHLGEEVVVRARVALGGWGPPRRLLVPGAGDEEVAAGVSTLVIHQPGYVLTEVVARTAEGEVRATGTGSVVMEVRGSPVIISAGRLSQALRPSGGESVDLYF